MNWAISTWTGTLTTDRRIPTPVSGYDAATTAWVAAVGSGNVTTDRKDLINAIIVGLKTDGIWTKLDRLWIFRAENSTCALTDLKALAVATAVNSPTFTTDRGYTGNGSTSYINTNFTPATSGVNFVLSTACFGLWDVSTSSSGPVALGINYYGHMVDGTLNYGGDSYWRINSSGYVTVAYPGPGFHMTNRSGASAQQVYYNGASIASGTAGSTILPVAPVFVLARNNDDGPTPSDFSTDQISVVIFGGTLSSTEHGNLYTRLNTYVTATP